MKIINPSVELWKQDSPLDHIARCARVCYRSSKTTGNDKLVNNLLAKGHMSMFRHETIYVIIPEKEVGDMWYRVMSDYIKCPYITWMWINHHFYVVTNGNFYRDMINENPVLAKWLEVYIVEPDVFESNETAFKELSRYTFHVTTQISTSRELNRVSPNNIAEESTRYVYEDSRICKPWWLDINDDHLSSKVYTQEAVNHIVDGWDNSFKDYSEAIKCGMQRQDAREVLPLATATECVYTYTIKEWRHILDLRYYGTTGKPHENAKIIASKIRDTLIELGHEFE